MLIGFCFGHEQPLLFLCDGLYDSSNTGSCAVTAVGEGGRVSSCCIMCGVVNIAWICRVLIIIFSGRGIHKIELRGFVGNQEE